MHRVPTRRITIPFTGLSCLNEWTTKPQDGISQEISQKVDDCPCHGAFVSAILPVAFHSIYVAKVVSYPPATYPSEVEFLLFRPPVSASLFSLHRPSQWPAVRPVRVHLDAVQVTTCPGLIWFRDELVLKAPTNRSAARAFQTSPPFN
jgi:hypothetical protein